jgi:hypothetical protein
MVNYEHGSLPSYIAYLRVPATVCKIMENAHAPLLQGVMRSSVAQQCFSMLLPSAFGLIALVASCDLERE